MHDVASKSSRAFKQLQDNQLDVLVIGGGIVGAGVARDAAMRGLQVAIVEQGDFASGTSSRSSRLLHGGIRYLAQARIGLVREASREKKIVHRIAPHLSEPLAFIFPTRKKSSWARWKLAAGVKLYDLLCGGRNLGRSRVLSRSQTIDLLPHLATSNLTGAVRYFDALTNDARLVLDTMRSAAQHGATVHNYTRFLGADYRGGLWHCRLELVEGRQRLDVVAKCVVNAGGPWSHLVPNSCTMLRLTKGVHLVVNRSRLPVPDAVVLTEGDRILFAIPWGDRVILGTTDTDYDGPIEEPACEPADLRYVLAVVNDAFPGAQLDESDVISTWAGLRPLVADRRGNPSDISRRHEVNMNHPGWWDVTGGKLTTYRLMAEEAVDQIARFLKSPVSGCRTGQVPLLPARDAQGRSGILPPEVSEAVTEYFCREEWAVHLDDVMIRRTSWRHYHADHLAIAATVADWMSRVQGWTDEVKAGELARYQAMTEGNRVPPPHFSCAERSSVARKDPRVTAAE